MAKEKGLEPLAQAIFNQDNSNPEKLADSYLDEESGVNCIEDALAGARDIIAEWINEDAEIREAMRRLFRDKGIVNAKVIGTKREEASKYKDYFDYSEPVKTIPSHRLLAVRRGENEMMLSVKIAPPEEDCIALIERLTVKSNTASANEVKLAIKDCYKRLLGPSMETELRVLTKESADMEAIEVFADNVHNLLLAPPLGEKSIIAIDPGFRTGCKVASLDANGTFLEYNTIFPHGSDFRRQEAAEIIHTLVEKYNPFAIAVGNGTAGRETESWLRTLSLPASIKIISVSEAGASVYSASEVAIEEFPDQDVTVRGAISIGRRLQDPLSELVKIDPKAIGVGQYQHDVNQVALTAKLDDVVLSCVNSVGVELNTASAHLLQYVSGIGKTRAQSIVDHRMENGPFRSRESLKKVKGIGKKAFEQAAGFLRIRNGENPLDSSAVHPESYSVVQSILDDLNLSIEEIMQNENMLSSVRAEKYVTDVFGLPTINDILDELRKPGRDPRESFDAVNFDDSIQSIEDLQIDMVVPGIVTNVTNFGAFVDIGVHQDGLIHISQLANRFVKHPSEIVKVNQAVKVRIIDVDHKRKRISLSMKQV